MTKKRDRDKKYVSKETTSRDYFYVYTYLYIHFKKHIVIIITHHKIPSTVI